MAISEEHALERITSAALVLAGAATFASVILPPSPSDFASTQALVDSYASERESVRSGVILGTVGIWGFVVGFANIHHFIGFGVGAAWGRLGFYTLVIGAAALTAASGISLASTEVAALDAGTVEHWVIASTETRAIAGLGFGVGLLFIAFAANLTTRYPTWSSVILGLIALVNLGNSVFRLFTDGDEVTASVEAIVIAALAVWSFVTGLWLLRKVW